MIKLFTIIAITILSNLVSIAQKATLSGEYASRALSITETDKVYFEGFRFINATDSFYYWYAQKEQGIGTYKIVDNKLYLNFEDDHIKKYPIKSYEIFSSQGDRENHTVIFRFLEARNGKYIRGGMIQVVTASGNKRVKVEVQDSVSQSFSKADFPLQIKAYYPDFKKIQFTIDTIGSYDVDLLFHPREVEKLTSGEVHIFEMGKLTDTMVELRAEGDSSFLKYKKIK
jgi:hypothetical protein